MQRNLKLTCLFASLCIPATALAQPSSVEPDTDAPIATAFATMDRSGDRSLVSATMGFSSFDDGGPDVGLRTDLYGQYMAPAGYGGYVTLPISFVSGNDETETAMGNVELGGLYSLKGNVPVLFRAGLSIGTTDDEDINNLLTNYGNAFGRLTDFASVFPSTSWLRLSASPVIKNGKFFARADFGLDIPFSTPEGADIDPLMRINLGAGMMIGKTALMAELVTIGTTGDVDDDSDRFLHTAAITARFFMGNVEPVVSIIVPLDEEVRDGFIGVNAVVMAGVQMPFGN